jgi:hypothetical protein
MSAETLQSNGPKPEITRSVASLFFGWLTQIGGAVARPIYSFLRPAEPAPAVTAEQCADRRAESAAVTVTATESAQIEPVAQAIPDEREIQRRRDLVRTLFNDFWNGSYDKPATFADRLDQAENCLNERLIARGEFWQLDAKTRVLLGLPPRSISFNKGQTG